MELFLENHSYKYAVEQIMLMLFPEERPVYPAEPSGAPAARVRLSEGQTWVTATTALFFDGVRYDGMARVRRDALRDAVISDRLKQRALKQSFYRAGVRRLGRAPVWGSLSGIRPAKLLRNLLHEGMDEGAAMARFIALYDVAPERAALCMDAARSAEAEAARLLPRDVCLYVGVPFCPTRCAYCSFVSQSVERSMALIPAFVDALLLDIRATAAAVTEAELRPVALYFGGGTPTTLSADELERVFAALEATFDLSACREITVEAGRPDTITAEKLAVLRAHGVSRVSVNPQTMSDRVLSAIGRRHSAADVYSALETVRAAGQFQVNMDLIAGLPEDTVDSFRATVEQVLALGAENITVHTLALKKGSRLMLEGTRLPAAEEVGEMLSFAAERLRGGGYRPYYLYRQKFMSGGFENVGWCLPGTENRYNICIMEELCSILALGAGASTKLLPGAGRVKRFFAPKYAAEYIAGIEKVCADKRQIVDCLKGTHGGTL
ncbi:MAG: coproporphyrinogen dehydrogenase HemZ [Oscillospiraceae bacterium]|nr:coproporphyrinogen dehydrogenase HemZ [Oscillospiraceae bacterium]